MPVDVSTSDASTDTTPIPTDAATTGDTSDVGSVLDGAACAGQQRSCNGQCVTCPTDTHATEFACNGSACIIRSCAVGYTVTAQACTANLSFPFSGAPALVRPPTGQLHVSSIALSGDGNVLVIGDGGRPPSGGATGPGSVTTYARNAGAWGFTGTVARPSNSEPVTGFGATVALTSDANTLFVRGYHGYTNGYVVTIFARSGGGWNQVGALARPDRDPGFGTHLALSADDSTLLQGTGSISSGDQNFRGRAHVYTRSAGSWGQPTELMAAATPQYFGSSLAVSGDGSALAVGDFSNGGAGVTAYDRNGATWTGARVAPPSDASAFGTSLALSRDGRLLVVGDWTGGANRGGVVTVFARANGAWVAGNSPMRPSGATLFGRRVVLSSDGNVMVVGRSGHATVYVRTDGAWNSGDELVIPSAISEPVYLVLSSDDSTLAMSDDQGDVVAIYHR